jgi:hypothetical protein
MNNLACRLSEKYDEVDELEKNYVELSNSISESDDYIHFSPKYNELLEELKKNKEISKEFLILKMYYGDKIASRLYMDLSMTVDTPDKSTKKVEINEDDVLKRVKDIVLITNGFGAKSFAQYQAIEYLKDYNLKDSKYRCEVNLEEDGDKNTKTDLKHRNEGVSAEKLLGWRSIKYLKYPKNAKVHNSTYWSTKWNKFPGIIEYGKTRMEDCLYETKNITYVEDISQINLYKNCEIQILGDQTSDTEKKEIIKVMVDGNLLNVKFFVSEKTLDYNCLGHAIGVMDFLNPHIYTNPPRGVSNKQELNLYLKQFKEALMAIKNESQSKRKSDVSEKSLTYKSSMLEKIKPAPSLMNSLMNNKEILDTENYITGIIDDITDEQILKVCRGNLNEAVIFYGGDENRLTHAARYSSELKRWTSKLGYSYLVTHSLHLLDNTKTELSLYGAPKFIYCPNGVDNSSPGAYPDRPSF